jgi:Leucine-rich repeat (LRR) protein
MILTNLGLSTNQISDISVLSGLTTLRYLDLEHNHIGDISAVSNLTNLNALWLSDNQITDISALSGLTNLETLSLHGNQVNDISALLELTGLKYLDLLNNPLNTSAYYIYLPVISSFNPKLTSLTYDPNPNLLTDDWGVELPNLIEFTNHFGKTGCGEQNDWCGQTDLNQSGSVDVNDFAELLEYYLRALSDE